MASSFERWRESFSRRRFLRLLGASALGGVVGSWRTLPALGAPRVIPAAPPDFEVIPPSTSGITWVHVAGLSSHMYMPESLGPGAAVLDYDNDGWMDIYLVNSGPCDFYTPPKPLRNALYRNNRDGTFTDVTEKAGVVGNAYGMGAAVGDYDGDGYPDIFVTQYPRSILYHNNRDGTFTDVTEKAGISTPGWTTSAVWFDYDNDGRLDLFVCSFVKYDKAMNKFCGDTLTGQGHYCKPNIYPGSPCWLYHNNGDGTFTDVTKKTGLTAPAKAWSAVAGDFNHDGWMDLFVTNDTIPNFLFLNDGKGHFQDNGLLAGLGYNLFGMARSSMGADGADYDQDGWIDFAIGNVDHEMFALYHGNPDGTYTDIAPAGPIGPDSNLFSGMSVRFFDYDNDGNIDLMFVDSHPDTMINEIDRNVHYREPMLLFRNDGGNYKTCWKDVSKQSGPIFSERLAAHGLALGDFDNNGSVDAVVTLNDAGPILLRNNAGLRNHWLGVRLIGKKSNIDAVGATLNYQAGPLRRHFFKVGTCSYMCYGDPRVVLGLGQQTKVDWLEVKWPQPGGTTERFTNVPIDRYITIVEGEGKWK